MKPARLKNSTADTKAMVGYLSLFASLGAPPSRTTRAHGGRNSLRVLSAADWKACASSTAVYWRWLAAQAEAWS